MTVFAGIIGLNGHEISNEAFDKFKLIFEKCSSNQTTFEKKTNNGLMLSYDIDVLKAPNYIDDEEQTSIVAGDPLIRNSIEQSLVNDIEQIKSAGLTENLPEILSQAKGVFSGVSWQKKNVTTLLYTDKLGIRPVYYYQKGNIFIYSSLKSLFEQLPNLDLSIDYQGMIEHLEFGCLSDRTVYKYIKRLNCAEIIEISHGAVNKSSYWDWNQINLKKDFDESDIKALFDSFESAIKLRLANNTNAIAFLSGGLDSRVIASIVKKHTKEIYTFNFASQRSQDNEFARLFAEQAELKHNEKLFATLAYPNWSKLMSDVVSENDAEFNEPIDKNVIWSGDGGSVGLGYVYINEEMQSFLKNNDKKSAAISFLKSTKSAFPIGFLKGKYRKNTGNMLMNSVTAELESNPDDPAKAMYCFLMNNDQKRHLEVHFETICDHKVELHLPFFDSEFLSRIYAIPSQELLYHKLYIKWFEYFPESARQTPWQTYPEHVPCPIKSTSELSYQWNNKKTNNSQRRKEDFSYYLSINNNSLITTYFDKKKLMLAMLLHRFGFKSYSYLINYLKKMAMVKTVK